MFHIVTAQLYSGLCNYSALVFIYGQQESIATGILPNSNAPLSPPPHLLWGVNVNIMYNFFVSFIYNYYHRFVKRCSFIQLKPPYKTLQCDKTIFITISISMDSEVISHIVYHYGGGRLPISPSMRVGPQRTFQTSNTL